MNGEYIIHASEQPPSFLKVRKANVSGFKGGVTKSYEYLERADSVAVLIFHRDRRVFTWIEQFRIGQATRRLDGIQTTFEPVAGMVDPGQTPEEAARREVLEESGVQATNLERVGSFLMCPGVSTERMHLYVAEVEGQPLNTEGGLEEEHEDITVIHWSGLETQRAMANGDMDNPHAMLLWQWVQLNRPEWVR